MREFSGYGVVASEALVRALLLDHDKWADAVLSQCFKVPREYREALLAGEAEWQIPNSSTITIGLAKAS